MKRFFTFAVLTLLVAVGANAQSLRKTWDFRQGFSTKTVNALKADQEEFGPNAHWRNYEGDATKADEQHFWCAAKGSAISDENGNACTFSGDRATIIPELEGLSVSSISNAKKFVITYDGSQSENEGSPNGFHPYGKSYVWINGKNEVLTFQAEVNQKIRIGVESHSNSQDRGIGLTTNGGSLELLEGNATPTFFNECVWNLTGDAGTVATLTIKTTNGCHIYYIIVGEGDDPNANKTKVAYITVGDATSEAAYQTIAADEQIAITAIDASSATVTANQLQEYQGVVVSSNLPADNAAASVLKENLPYLPVLNLNASLYAAWGYGEAVAAEMPLAVISNLNSELFDGFQLDADYIDADGLNAIQLGEALFTGVKLGDYFAGDPILAADANDPELAAIHVHNLYHNAYIYIPAEGAGMAAKLMGNAIAALKASKSSVEKVGAPKIALEYKNLNTNIVLSMASRNLPKAHIYYTLDGSEPTEQSAEYTEPLNVTSVTTVKAVAIAEGYLLSDVVTAEADIFAQPATPVVTSEYEDGKTIVTLSCETEGVDVWYNFTTGTDTIQSMRYTQPIELTLPTDFTAFAVAAGQVFSEPAAQRIVVKNVVVRQDQIGAFDANAADFQVGGSGSTIYYFTWGKNARSIYDTNQEPVSSVTDPETGDVTDVYPEYDYEYYLPLNEDGTAKGQWEVKSKGQVMIWQSLTFGKDPGNPDGYNPDTAGDILDYAPITSNDIQFGGKTSGEPCTGAIQSLVKFQGPFDVAAIVGTAAGGSNVGKMLIEVSTDSLTWEAIGDTMTTSTVKRLWKTYTRSYNGTDEVYVRVVQAGGGSSVQIPNVYILNEGENSKTLKAQYDEEYAAQATGINEFQPVKAAPGIYSVGGIRQAALKPGLNIIVDADGQATKLIVR